MPCPPIPPRPGPNYCLVTTRFEHESAEVVDVKISGDSQSIGVTTNHPFWSETRQAFITAGDLQNGERLLAADGTIHHVAYIHKRPGLHKVYNLEVDGEHVYYVGQSGLLVHNAYSSTAKYSIYTGWKKSMIDYIGITKNFILRQKAHQAAGLQIREAVVNAGYRQSRALEHVLIQRLRDLGYTLSNKQRGVSPKSMHKYTSEHWRWANEHADTILRNLGV